MNQWSPLLPPGTAPFLDGKTPVFVEVGADPTAGAGLQLPIGSIAKFGSSYFLKNGALATAWTTTFGGGGAGFSVLAPTVTLAAAAESIGWTGLTLNTDRDIRAHFRIKNASGGARVYVLHVNGATTGLAYQRIIAGGATLVADTNASFGGALDGWVTDIILESWADEGTGLPRIFHCRLLFTDAAGAIQEKREIAIAWSNTTDEITALAIDSDGATGCGIGSTASIVELPS